MKASVILELVNKFSRPSKQVRDDLGLMEKGTGKLKQKLDQLRNSRPEKVAERMSQTAEKASRAAQKLAGKEQAIQRIKEVQVRQEQRLLTLSRKRIAAQQRLAHAYKQMEHAKSLSQKTAIAGGVGLGVGYGVKRLLTPLIGEAVQLESAMADVKKVVEFKTPEGVIEFQNRIQRLSREIPIASVGLAQIAASGGQLGIAKDKLLPFVQVTAKMSTAFDMLPDAAGDAMAKLSNIYNIPIRSIGNLGDAINHLSDNTAAKAREIVTATKGIGGIAKEFGLLPVQAAALSSTFIALGKAPEVASTASNALMLKLKTASTQSKPFQQALASIGYTAKGLEQSIGHDAQGALLSFLQTVKKLPDGQRLNTLSMMFGAEYSDDISMLVGSLDKYQQALSLTSDKTKYLGSMQREFENRSNTTGNKYQLLTNRVSELREKLGRSLLPALNSLMKTVSPLIEKMSQWAAEHPKLISYIGMGVMAIGALSAVTGGLLLTLAPLILGLYASRTAFAMLGLKGGLVTNAFRLLLTVIRSIGIALLANPIGLAIAVIAGGAYLIYKNWDKLVSWWNSWTLHDVGYAVGEKLGQTAVWLKQKWQTFAAWWAGISYKDILLVIPLNPITAIYNLAKSFFNWWNGTAVEKKKVVVETSAIDTAWSKAKGFLGWWQKNMTLSGNLGKVRSFTAGVAKGFNDGGARATGGPVHPGNFYRVNERGPELLNIRGQSYLMATQAGHVSPLISKFNGGLQAANSPLVSAPTLRAVNSSSIPKTTSVAQPQSTSNSHTVVNQGSDTYNVTFNISGDGGQSVQRQVEQAWSQIQRRQSMRRNGALYDGTNG